MRTIDTGGHHPAPTLRAQTHLGQPPAPAATMATTGTPPSSTQPQPKLAGPAKTTATPARAAVPAQTTAPCARTPVLSTPPPSRPAAAVQAGIEAARGLAALPPGPHPVHRSIVAVMVEHEGRPTNSVRDELRRETYRLLDAALAEAGILPRHRDAITDHGGGLVALVKPVDEVPKTLLLRSMAPTLGRLVAARNAARADRPELRLRVVVHAGEVHQDAYGCFGESLDLAFRLLDTQRVKGFARALGDPVILVVSEEIYLSIVRHGYDGIDRRAFIPLLRIHDGRRRQVYVHVGSWRDAVADSGLAR